MIPSRALLLVPLAALAAGGAAAAVRPCARMVLADPLADPGNLTTAGAVIDVDPLQPPSTNTSTVGGLGPTAFLAHVAVGDARAVFVSDMEADPSALGPDPNGNPGRGAIFELLASGDLSVIADGTICGPTILNCGPSGAFVDPIGLAWGFRDALLAVADLDADPSGFGPDTLGFGGHGAIFAVDPASGTLDLIADGSNYADPIPTGAPTIFEDPVALAFGRDGAIYLVDQLAEPTALRNPGAVFRVDPGSGAVTLVAAFPQSRGLRDVAVEPAGTLLVLDRIAGGRGTLFRIDPALPPMSSVVATFTSPLFVEPHGLVVEGNGRIYVIDAAADPLGTGSGAVFEIDAALTGATALSNTMLSANPWAVDLLEPESLDAVLPPAGDRGTSLTVTLTGGLYDLDASVVFGGGIAVDAVTVVDPATLQVDITIPPGATPGRVDVTIRNAGARTNAFHCELFDILPGGLGCTPAQPIAGTLHVMKAPNARVRLAWIGTGDPCAAAFRVRRAPTAIPTLWPLGDWPDDPDFRDVTLEDEDGSDTDDQATLPARAGEDEYFLITEVGTNGLEGPPGAYGP